MQGGNLNDALSVQLDDALIRPRYLIDIASTHLQASHFYLVLAALRSTEVFVRLEITGHEEFGLVDIGNILLSDNLFDSVEGVDEPEPAVVALYQFLSLQLLDGFVEAAEVEGPVADRA